MSTCSKNGEYDAREKNRNASHNGPGNRRERSQKSISYVQTCVYIYNQSIEDSINFDLKNKSFLFDE